MLSSTVDRLSRAAREWSMRKVLTALPRKDCRESKLKLTKESTSDSGVCFLYPVSLSPGSSRKVPLPDEHRASTKITKTDQGSKHRSCEEFVRGPRYEMVLKMKSI